MPIALTEEEVDVDALLAAGQERGRLHVLVRRGSNEGWLVASRPIALDSRVEWSPVRAGDFVMVPLIPYRTHQDVARALKFAITLGLRAGLDVHPAPGRDPKRLHLVTAAAADDLAESEGIAVVRFYLGFAIQTH